MFEPLASTQLSVLPSVGILTLDHLTSSGVAAAGSVGEIMPSRLSSKASAETKTKLFVFAIWQILALLESESQFIYLTPQKILKGNE
jgi:hypothetical protein